MLRNGSWHDGTGADMLRNEPWQVGSGSYMLRSRQWEAESDLIHVMPTMSSGRWWSQHGYECLSPRLLDPIQQWDSQVRSFYTIIFQCQNVDSDLITISITSDCFNPLGMYHEIWRVYINSWCDWLKVEKLRTVLKLVSLISTLAACKHRNQLPRLISKRIITDSFLNTIEWKRGVIHGYIKLCTLLLIAWWSMFSHIEPRLAILKFGICISSSIENHSP